MWRTETYGGGSCVPTSMWSLLQGEPRTGVKPRENKETAVTFYVFLAACVVKCVSVGFSRTCIRLLTNIRMVKNRIT